MRFIYFTVFPFQSDQTFKNIDVHVHVHLLGTNFMFEEIITGSVKEISRVTTDISKCKI